MESEDFRFFPHRNPGTNTCLCITIYTIFFPYPTPQYPTPPPRPPQTRGVGGVGWGIGGVGYEKNIVYI